MSLTKARKLKGVRPRYNKVGSAEKSDFPKDTELELNSLGMIALEGGTSSSGTIERAVDMLKTCCRVIRLVSEIVSKEKLSQCEK